MTIEEMRTAAAELETQAAEFLKGAADDYQKHNTKQKRKNRDAEYLKAYNNLLFWTNVRNGFRQAADALHALEMIAEGSDWKENSL